MTGKSMLLFFDTVSTDHVIDICPATARLHRSTCSSGLKLSPQSRCLHFLQTVRPSPTNDQPTCGLVIGGHEWHYHVPYSSSQPRAACRSFCSWGHPAAYHLVRDHQRKCSRILPWSPPTTLKSAITADVLFSISINLSNSASGSVQHRDKPPKQPTPGQLEDLSDLVKPYPQGSAHRPRPRCDMDRP